MVYQLTPALLEALVLSIAEGEAAYGYRIAQRLKTVANQKESFLYPVLKRLSQAGYLSAYDKEYQGRNRRYYSITDSGKEQLRFYREEWECFKGLTDEILNGGSGNEQE